MTEDEASSTFIEHSLNSEDVLMDMDAVDHTIDPAALDALKRFTEIDPKGTTYAPDGQRISVLESMNWWDLERHVAKTFIGPYEVSTVFIPRDLSGGMAPVPLLWETMMWGPKDSEVMNRYPSATAAGAGHLALLEHLARGLYYRAEPGRRHGMMRHLRSVRRSVRHLGVMDLPRPPRSYRVYFEMTPEGGRLVWPEGRPTPGSPYENV